jgi:hypothetical protein
MQLHSDPSPTVSWPTGTRLAQWEIMADYRVKLPSHFRRKPARHITLIHEDGTVVRSTEAAARLSDMIAETLGGQTLSPASIGQQPVELVIEDLPPPPSDLMAALLFAKKAS